MHLRSICAEPHQPHANNSRPHNNPTQSVNLNENKRHITININKKNESSKRFETSVNGGNGKGTKRKINLGIVLSYPQHNQERERRMVVI